MKPNLSLIISTYDRPEALEKVFLGVSRQTMAPTEILIANDGAEPAIHEVVAHWQTALRAPVRHFAQSGHPQGKTTVLNHCLASATGDYIVLLDGDCVPHTKFIADHASAAEKGHWVQGRRCYVRQSKVKFFSIDSTPILQWMCQGKISAWSKGIWLPFPVAVRSASPVSILGCNMAFWREDALAVNGFDEEFVGWGHEDADFGVRLYHLGRKRKFLYGRAIIYHLNHPWVDRLKAESSRLRLDETINSQKIRCERGMDQYLADPVKPS